MARTSEPTRPVSRELARLAREHGIMTSYLDVAGRRQTASTESILSVLNVLGVEIDRPEQVKELLRCGREECRLRGLEPVYVAWDGRLPSIALELESETPDARIAYALSGEGQTLEGVVEEDSLSRGPAAGAGRREVRIPPALEPGYYDLELAVGGRRFRSFVISSPTWAYHLGPRKEWGCFLPLYALRTQGDWGIGDLTGLQQLTQWVADWGAGAVGALPLYAAFLDELYEPSPYRPVSRLFWNDVYLDVPSVYARFGQERGSGPADEAVIGDWRRAEDVDYAAIARLKRAALEPLAHQALQEGGASMARGAGVRGEPS